MNSIAPISCLRVENMNYMFDCVENLKDVFRDGYTLALSVQSCEIKREEVQYSSTEIEQMHPNNFPDPTRLQNATPEILPDKRL